jgi:hypothetical protein
VRGHKLLRLGAAAAEDPERLGVSEARWREIAQACGQRVATLEFLRYRISKNEFD